MTKQKTILVTAAIAGLLVSGAPAFAKDAKTAVGECHGVNSCKGKGECASEGSSCKGQNSCKGKGWVKLSKAKCDKKKGTFTEMVKM